MPDTLFRDPRYGARLLRRAPAFGLMAVISLALGIGANTAIFQLIDAVRLRTFARARAGGTGRGPQGGQEGSFGRRVGPGVSGRYASDPGADPRAAAGVFRELKGISEAVWQQERDKAAQRMAEASTEIRNVTDDRELQGVGTNELRSTGDVRQRVQSGMQVLAAELDKLVEKSAGRKFDEDAPEKRKGDYFL